MPAMGPRPYRVQYINPENGRGFITGFRTARDAKAAVERVTTHPLNHPKPIMVAKYLGHDDPQRRT